MSKIRIGNNMFLKEHNQKEILDLIRTTGAISRADISSITGLSPTAVGSIVANLMEQGYIHQRGVGESTGGRRPVLLELKPRSFYSIGVDFDIDYINIILVDITGEIISEKLWNTPNLGPFENTMLKIESLIREILNESSIDVDVLLGIGLSVPGLVDIETGKLVLAPNMGWMNVDPKGWLEKLFPVPVFIENESMASAICENWIGSCKGVNNFVCINIKSGIGAGIFTGGELYRGESGTAGEIGHIVVDENGPKCGCGNYGCLETMASTSRIAEKARRLVRQGIASSLNAVADVEDIDIEQVIKAAREGDEAAKNILMESARYLGIAIAGVVNTLNPSKVIIGKEFVKYANLVLDHIKSVVALKALKSPASKVEIMASPIGEKASALGAAVTPLKTLFGR